jgi:hypothetical protein
MDLEKLKEPFKPEEVEFRLAQCGESGKQIWAMCLAYIQARAIQDRLDQVCSPENWRVSYEFIRSETTIEGVICNLSIKVGNEWITKQDGAETTDIESFKGGISSALKRAGSAWGMGRYLYNLEAAFARIVEKGTPGAQFGKTKNGTQFYWLPPELPQWALPKTPSQTTAMAPTSEEKKIITPKTKDFQEQANMIKWLFTIAHETGWVENDLRQLIKSQWGYESTKTMSADEIRQTVDYMKSNPPPSVKKVRTG